MEYVGGVSPFAVFFICSYNMEILVKTDGTPLLSTIGVSLAGVTNLVLDWLFVMIFHWGVRGAAVATGLPRWCLRCFISIILPGVPNSFIL